MIDKFNLSDRVVIITGGAGLLGREYVHALLNAGAKIIIADIDDVAIDQLITPLLKSYPNHILGVQTNVADKQSVASMVEKSLETYGRIDGLVNNAAIDPKFDSEEAQSKHTPAFEDYPLELWQKSLDVNITGMFLCAQAVAPAMLRQGAGVVVNVSSMYGLVGPDQRLYERDDPNLPQGIKPVTYSVTKAAVLGLTKYLATYWGGKGIRTNTLTLGGVFNNHSDEFLRRYIVRTPLERMANRDEYCGALLFLLSDASSYMLGSNLIVDGGWTAW